MSKNAEVTPRDADGQIQTACANALVAVRTVHSFCYFIEQMALDCVRQ